VYTEDELAELVREFTYAKEDGILRRTRSMKPAYVEHRKLYPVVVSYALGKRVNARKLVVFLANGRWPDNREVRWTGTEYNDLRWECFTFYTDGVNKICASCSRVLAIDEFHANSRNKSKLHSYCKDCAKEKYKQQRLYYRDVVVERKFGMQDGEYQERLAAQGGVCAICKLPCTRELAVDHCHKTGVVRGLLCAGCNTALGKFHDDPKMLLRAAKYLLAATTSE
jgi:hypothetical protein